MIVGDVCEEAKPVSGRIGKSLPHGSSIITMSPDTQVRVIGEYRTLPDRVAVVLDDLREGFANGLPLRVVEAQDRRIEPGARLLPELPQLGARRLHWFSAEMDRSQVLELLLAQLVGAAAAGVIGEPEANATLAESR